MYGQTVTIKYKNKRMDVYVPCVPSITQEELKERAFIIAERMEKMNS